MARACTPEESALPASEGYYMPMHSVCKVSSTPVPRLPVGCHSMTPWQLGPCCTPPWAKSCLGLDRTGWPSLGTSKRCTRKYCCPPKTNNFTDFCGESKSTRQCLSIAWRGSHLVWLCGCADYAAGSCGFWSELP